MRQRHGIGTLKEQLALFIVYLICVKLYCNYTRNNLGFQLVCNKQINKGVFMSLFLFKNRISFKTKESRLDKIEKRIQEALDQGDSEPAFLLGNAFNETFILFSATSDSPWCLPSTKVNINNPTN